MGGGNDRNDLKGWSSRSSDDLVEITKNVDSLDIDAQSEADSNPWTDEPSKGLPSPATVPSTPNFSAPPRVHLIFSKSHVYIHPSSHSKDNICGYLGLAEISGGDGNGKDRETALFWVPMEMAHRLGEEGGYKNVEASAVDFEKNTEMAKSEDAKEDDYVFITLPTSSTPPIPNPRSSASSGPAAIVAASSVDSYAFSIPLSRIYSLLVLPPTLRNWYGSITVNLLGGVSLPNLHFHDDESPSTLSLMSTQPLPASRLSPTQQRLVWGASPLFNLLRSGTLPDCDLLRSRLEPNLYLLNPTKADREVHSLNLEEERVLPKGVDPNQKKAEADVKQANYPPEKGFPSTISFPTMGPPGSAKDELTLPNFLHPTRTQFLSSFSLLTQQAKKITTEVLSHPLAKPVLPHLPEPVRSLVTVPGEWESVGERSKSAREAAGNGQGRKNGGNVAGEFESARIYLARWARVVAEEGERARRDEVAAQAGFGSKAASGKGGKGKERSDLGVFEFVRSSRGTSGIQPSTTRTPGDPVREEEFLEWQEKGLNEATLRGEVFKRGCSEEGEVRKWVWEVLLGVVEWDVGLGLPPAEGRARRDVRRGERRKEYEDWRNKWRGKGKGKNKAVEAEEGQEAKDGEEELEKWREEWHRIDLSTTLELAVVRLPPPHLHLSIVPLESLPSHQTEFARFQVDCRRTDRSQPMYAVPEDALGNEEKEGGGAGAEDDSLGESEEGSQTPLNPHIATLRTILMTYHTYSPELGYVQGMSDLLSPIYVVFEADEAGSFWGLVGVMKFMEDNFLRDQSGMKVKLSKLTKLISVMDPELNRRLERTGSLNLFFVFRWILISFKREFSFENVIKLWDVLFTNYYSNDFVLFVVLAVLHSHREVICRYLTTFDEILKYSNDLSGTIDLESTLAQAEVLYLSFRSLVEEVDRNEAIRKGTSADGLRKRRGSSAAASVIEEPDVVSDDLRTLLVGWKA